MQGPTNIAELREQLRPRAFPDGTSVQTASDRLRDKAFEIGSVLFGLVPDSDYQQLVGNVLHDLVVIGEATLCQLREVKGIEHDMLRVLKANALAERTYAPELASSEPPPKPRKKA
jgi:hypothetical protein